MLNCQLKREEFVALNHGKQQGQETLLCTREVLTVSKTEKNSRTLQRSVTGKKHGQEGLRGMQCGAFRFYSQA
jgi:hypothetical protein